MNQKKIPAKKYFLNKYPLYCIVLLSVLLTHCFQKKQSESDLPLQDTFRFTILTEPPTLDWNKATDTTSSLILNNIMEGLTEYDFSQPGIGLKPGLAQKWTASPDKKQWVFTLKPNIYWSDGQLLTARHVRDSWERLLNPKTASGYAYFLYSIKNAKAYNTGKITDFSQVGVQVNSTHKLTVQLEKSISFFPYFLSSTSTYPIRKDMIEKYGSQWTRAKNLVTLGPYKLKKWKHDQFVILERNNNYHSTPAKIKNIVIRIIEEMTTALHLFEQNKLDAMGNLPSQELSILRKKKEHRENAILAIYFYGFNTRKKPFDDVLVRKAFNMAINRKAIVKLLQGRQIPMTSWIPKKTFGYAPKLGLSFNPKKARQLLDQAGYHNRKTFPRVTVSYNTGELNKRVAENIQAQLKKNLQVSIEISSQEWKMYLQNLKTKKHFIYRLGWLGDYPDPHNFMNFMTSHSMNNYTSWGNPNYDALVQQASALPNNRIRFSLYNKAQKILVEQDVPVMPIFSSQSHWLINDRVINFPLNAMNKILFKNIKLKK